jgi:hypothetical protein
MPGIFTPRASTPPFRRAKSDAARGSPRGDRRPSIPMKSNPKELFNHKTKADFYIQHGRRKWGDLFKSVQYYLEKNDLSGEKVLEVACAAGGMYEIMNERYDNVRYTGMDIGKAEIKHAKKAYPKGKFLCGDFLENDLPDESFDTVCAFSVLNHTPRYREFISELFRLAKKRVIFDIRISYDYPTVVDLDVSYLYYHGSGKRNHFIPFNFYEIFNYLHLEKFRAKKISSYGYYTPDKASGFCIVPKNKIIAGAFCIEKYSKKDKIERWGGHPQFAKRSWVDYEFKLPDFSPEQV